MAGLGRPIMMKPHNRLGWQWYVLRRVTDETASRRRLYFTGIFIIKPVDEDGMGILLWG